MPTQLADAVLDSTAYNNGDNATNAVLSGSLYSIAGLSAGFSGSNAVALKVGSDITTAPYCNFSVNGSVRNLTASKGFKYDHTYSANDGIISYPAQGGTISFCYLWTTNIISQTGGSGRVDFSVVQGNTGKSLYDNYNVGDAGQTRGHRTETTVSNVSVVGSTISPCGLNTTYHVTGKYTLGNPGSVELRVYETTAWTLVGISSGSSDSASTSAAFAFGSDAATSNFAGYFSSFKAIAISLSGTFPLGVPEQPDVPTGFSAGTPTITSIPLTWTPADTKEQVFQVFRSFDNTYFGLIATCAEASTNYTDTSLPPGQTAYYKVRAHNVIFDSSFSATVSATTTALTSSAPSCNAATIAFR